MSLAATAYSNEGCGAGECGPSSAEASSTSAGSVGAEGAVLRAGHSLTREAILDGKLVNARPLGAALKTVLASMLNGTPVLQNLEEERGVFFFSSLYRGFPLKGFSSGLVRQVYRLYFWFSMSICLTSFFGIHISCDQHRDGGVMPEECFSPSPYIYFCSLVMHPAFVS